MHGTVWLLDDKKNLHRLNRQKDRFEIIIPAGKDIFQSGKADAIMQLGKASANRLLLTESKNTLGRKMVFLCY